ncbi:MAG TPA: AAA family ATPase [Gaiellales bacterium]|jgi:hypothetical protein|nr:AAA family ATPase [Gaiellales bacterium]
MTRAEDLIREALVADAFMNGNGGEHDDDWQPQSLITLASRPPEPPTVGGLFYPGRRHIVSGEFECGKSWLLLCVAADELIAGRGVVWIDADDMGSGATLERLRQLGVADERIHTHFGYLRPSAAYTSEAWDGLERFVRDSTARLAVFDAFNPALAIQGLDPGKTPEVEQFYKAVVDPFKAVECAAVLLDHLVKNPETSRRYSYGSERKATGADVHLGLTGIAPFGRGKTGRAKIAVHKDRPGFLTRPSPGVLTVDSSPNDGRCSWHIAADASTTGDGDFRPTGLMEKVSKYLELFTAEPKSRAEIEEAVTGKRDYVRVAIDILVRESYAEEEKGKRGARLVRLVRAFREDEMGDE